MGPATINAPGATRARAAATAAPMPLIRANGLDINYTAEGSGPPLVMLHGATSSALEDWSAQRPLFRQRFRLYLVDARGHAGTRWDATQGVSSSVMVDDLLAFVDAMGLATFHLAGFSMGALTALWFASRHPERLRTLVAVGVGIEHEPRTSVVRRLMDPDRIEREEPSWAAQLERRHAPVQGPGAWRALLRAIARETATQPLLTPADLRAVQVPTLLVFGDRDVFVPPDQSVRLFRQLPAARLFIVPDCGHHVPASRPGLFNEAAAVFYRSTAEEAAERAAAGPEALRGIVLRRPARIVRPPHRSVLELPDARQLAEAAAGEGGAAGNEGAAAFASGVAAAEREPAAPEEPALAPEEEIAFGE